MAIDNYEAKAAETRKSKLPVDEQDKYLAELNEVINILTDRLSAVLVPEFETPMKDPTERAPEPPKSEMHHRLNDHNYQIRKAIGKVNSLLERLEV